MEDSLKYILYFFIGLFIIMLIIRCINLYNVELSKGDLEEINDYRNELSVNSTNIENFSNKLREFKDKGHVSEDFAKSHFNNSKSKKEKFKDVKKETLSEYWKRLSKIDKKWNKDSRDVVKKALKFKDEFLDLFKF